MVRAFIALELSGEIRDRLREAQETLRGCLARFTFVDPAIIHITLKFLGEIDERKIINVTEALKTIHFMPYSLTTGTVTVNNKKRPHTVWCTIHDAGQGEKLFVLLEDTLAPLGFERETRHFTPHATLARVKDMDLSLFNALNLLDGKTYGSCVVSGIKLKKSTLTPLGPVYEDLLEVKW
jgi:2'-5' RNA ligase